MVLVEEILAVLIGGAIGSLLRFLFATGVNALLPKNFPWGIFFVNVLGSFIIGLLAGLLVGRFELTAFWRAGIFIGLLGGFTTFSSFSLDTISLIQANLIGVAATNVIASLVFSLLATALGLLLARAIVP